MLNRVHIDNYRCFVNFDCRPEHLQLVLGINGTGKTAFFDVLEAIRDFVCNGIESRHAFPADTLTAWDSRTEQSFELGIEGGGGQYEYRLVIEQDRDRDRNRIKSERLTFEGNPLYEFDGSDVHLYRDDSSPGPVFPFDWTRSAIATVPDRQDNQRLTWFRNRLSRVLIFAPDPVRMSARSEAEVDRPDRELHQIVSWLRHLSQESPDTFALLRDHLRDDVIEGLRSTKLERVSDATRMLKFEFEFTGNGRGRSSFELSLDHLSAGQRNLVALSTLLFAAVAPDTTLCIDEPDNFIALNEIQPWLTALSDRVADTDGQCLLISHHPEAINYLAAAHGLVFSRGASGPVRAKPFEWTKEEMIAPAEVVARGWA